MPVVQFRPSCPCGCSHPPGTPCPPSPPSCQPVISQMPMGVTDGSNALPGQVGEFISATASLAWQQNVPMSTSIGVLTVPPGDWDAWAFAQIVGYADTIDFYLSPLPAGVSHPMGQEFDNPAGEGIGEQSVMVGPMARINVTVPTALVFLVSASATEGNGNMTLYVYVRRVR